jgi:hypothetical protein
MPKTETAKDEIKRFKAALRFALRRPNRQRRGNPKSEKRPKGRRA